MPRDRGYYLKQAQKCREAAEQATSAAAKTHWREAERCWLALANVDPESAWRALSRGQETKLRLQNPRDHRGGRVALGYFLSYCCSWLRCILHGPRSELLQLWSSNSLAVLRNSQVHLSQLAKHLLLGASCQSGDIFHRRPACGQRAQATQLHLGPIVIRVLVSPGGQAASL